MRVSATSAASPKPRDSTTEAVSAARPVDRRQRHAPFDEARLGGATGQEGQAERDEAGAPQKRPRSRQRRKQRPNVVGSSERPTRRAPPPRAPRRRGSASGASLDALPPDPGSASSPAGRAPDRAARSRTPALSGARTRAQAQSRSARSTARAESAAATRTANRRRRVSLAPRAAPTSAPISATMENSRSASPTTLAPVAPMAFRIASVARLRSTKPCAALATPTPPTTSDSKPASVRNSANRSRSRLNSGETLRRERASHPACGKACLASLMKARTEASSGPPPGPPMMTRVVHRTRDPGWTSAVASRAACEMRTRGPRPTPVAKRSGSLVRMVRIENFASPIRMTSPSFRFSRASSASSAAAPNTPSFSDNASPSGIDGAKTAAPILGHDGSTALSSTSAASSLPALAMARIVATVDREP